VPVIRQRTPARAVSLARLPSPVLVLGAIGSVQLGSALAKSLFERAGPLGMTLLRLGVGALVLLALARPRPGGRSRRQLLLAIAFGASLAAMNSVFYSAIDRIPIGVAVTIEFAGPLAVAVAGSRRLLDLVWVVLAATGVVLLTRVGGGALDPLGLGLAGCAGACWAAYILLSQRVGRAFAGADGLALATAVGAVLAAPLGVAQAGAALGEWRVLAAGAGVGLLSAAIPYSLEIEALRRLPARVFGVLMSLEPAVGALAGLLVLGEALHPREIAAIVLVSLASAGAAWSDRHTPLD
jgi:inner membrane transporter RhtA